MSTFSVFCLNFSLSSGRHPSEELYRSPSQPTNVPWASLWQNVNNASTGQIRSHIEQLRNASSSSLSGYYPRVSAFRAPVKTGSSTSVNSVSAVPHPPVIAEYPRGFVPQQINPNKMSRWQSKTVTESEAERRNNSRMQRQHRRSTQGVTKEQLEEASKFATDEVARKSSQVLLTSAYPNTSTTQSLSSRSAVVAGLSPAPSMRPQPTTMSSTTATTSSRFMPSSSLSSNGSSSTTNQTSYGLQTRPTETNLNYKALFEKERSECERLRREMDDMRRSQTNETWRATSSQPAWRTRNASPSAQPHNLSVAKSTSLASFDENERRSMERKIADLELQLKTAQNLRMENQRLKEENGALVRVISKMTI